jgi:hypothetical protein
MAVENGFVTRATGTIEAAGFHTLIRIFSVVPIILLISWVHCSIENIKLSTEKPYLFTLGEKIFEILQFNFLTRLKSADSATQQDENAV